MHVQEVCSQVFTQCHFNILSVTHADIFLYTLFALNNDHDNSVTLLQILTFYLFICVYILAEMPFLSLGRWARRGIVVPFVHRRLRRRRRTHSFGYYTNMVQQINFIIHTNIQPLPALFFTQGQGQRSGSKI